MNDHQSDLLFCHHLGTRGYRPGEIMDGKEIVSFPFPEADKIFIEARTIPGDPASVKKFQIVLAKLVEAAQ